ncbi:MAG: inositol monophosphatase family protein [Dehalococcoidia bacterium]
MPFQLPQGTSGLPADQVALSLALQAGRTLRQRFGGPLHIASKGPKDLVTEVDNQVERQVLEALRREFPDFGLMAEETAQALPDEEWAWILDPLDGTRNFARGIPFFCVSLALAWRGQPVVGVIYDPLRDEAFHAVAGRGARLNEVPIGVSRKPDLASCIIGCDISTYDTLGVRTLDLLAQVFPRVMGGRTMGSAALGFAYTAAGRTDLYFHLRLRPWDVAAGLVLVKEAGGIATNFQGQPATLTSEGFVVGSGALVRQFLALVETPA